jgi:hypothetical protein
MCRNGSWADGPHEAVNSGWGDDAKTGVGAVSSWNEQPLTPTSWAGSKPKNTLNPGWVDGDLEPSSWVHAPKQASISPVCRLLLQHKHEPKLSDNYSSFLLQGPKPITKEFLWGSKQFRILAEMGFKVCMYVCVYVCIIKQIVKLCNRPWRPIWL